MSSVDDYLRTLPTGQKNALERVRKIVFAIVPEAEEVISYGMPTYKLRGQQFLNMAAFKNHMSLFGSVDEFANELKDFEQSGKGTVQFTEDKPIPEDLVKAIIQFRVKQIS